MGRSFQDHLDNLRQVFDRLRSAGLKLKPAKCFFGREKVEYLGYIVSSSGISTDPKKVAAVQGFSAPTDVKSLQSFWGLASYYRRFILNFSVVAAPLFALTRKDAQWIWDDHCQGAFDMLKHLLTVSPVLAFPLFDHSFRLDTDASGHGLGAVLSQQQNDGTIKPITYASRSLQQHEKNYGVTELEALGVVWAVKHFRHYLYGQRCDVCTDHEALKSLLNTPHPSGKLARRGLALQEVNLHVHYRPGQKNTNADALSRSPSQQVVGQATVASVCPQVTSKSREERDKSLPLRQKNDPKLLPIIQYLEDGRLPEDNQKARDLLLGHAQYTLLDGVLYHLEKDKTLRIVPPMCDRQALFEEAHSGPYGGHLRETKIHSELARHYWWQGMRRDIRAWCSACLTFATREAGMFPRVPLTPIPVAGPFDRVGVDVIQFPKSRTGKQYAVVFMDYLMKWPEVFATKDQTALTIAKLFVEHIVSRHGVPTQLLSNRGAAFLSTLLKQICHFLGISKVNTTAYHPQTDGLVERFNRTLTSMLSKRVETTGLDWDQQLPFVMFAYRSSLQESTQESPFFLLYGRDPRLPSALGVEFEPLRDHVDLCTYSAEVMSNLQGAWDTTRTIIQKAQAKQKRFHDRKAKAPNYHKGQRVFVHMPWAKQGKAYKFARPYHGPYHVVAVHDTGVSVCSIDNPSKDPIRVAFNRVHPCADGIPDVFWPSKTTTTLAPPTADLNLTKGPGVVGFVAARPVSRTPQTRAGMCDYSCIFVARFYT